MDVAGGQLGMALLLHLHHDLVKGVASAAKQDTAEHCHGQALLPITVGVDCHDGDFCVFQLVGIKVFQA